MSKQKSTRRRRRSKKKRNRMKERITTAYPRSAVMSFGYICVKRERMSLARVLFFSLSPSRFFSFLRSIKRFASMVAFFLPSFSLACIVFFLRSTSSSAAVAIVYIYTFMTNSGIVCEGCLTYEKLHDDWWKETM